MFALLRRLAQYSRVSGARIGRSLLQMLLFLALVAGIYGRALSGPFVFDDQTAIVENESLRSLWPISQLLAQPPDLTTSGRPVVALTFALDYAAAGADPRVFRATNFAIHALCALLLAGIVRRTLVAPRLADRFGSSAEPIALAAALIFLVHPLASEVVCYVSARTESLVALFYLATLYGSTRASASERPWVWVAVAIACSVLGMASKEVMVSAPVVVALHDVVFLGPADARQRRVRIALWSGLAASWAVLGFLIATQPRTESAGFALWVTPLVYLANQCSVLPEYLRLLFWPVGLRIDYGLPQPLGLGDVWAGASLLVGLFALALYALWRWPAAGFVGVACFAILAPSSSFVPIVSEVGAERRMYLPLAALCALVVPLGWLGLVRAGRARLGRVLAGVAVAALALFGAARAGDFSDEIRLWRADVEVAPGNARARYNLSGALRRAGRESEARDERAEAVRGEIDFYSRILPFQPDRARALGDLAAIHVVAGELARAEQLYGELLELDPGDATALRMRARLRAHLGLSGDASAAP